MTTTVSVVTAAKSLAIEAASIVSGAVNGSGHLILTKQSGSTVDAGSVVGPAGAQGPAGVNTIAALPAGLVLVMNFAGPGQPTRPTARTDIVVRWRGPFVPTAALTGDEFVVTT